MFEAVQFVEYRDKPEPVETLLGDFELETDAVEIARRKREEFLEAGADEYAWWVVRNKGARPPTSLPIPKVTKNSFSISEPARLLK